MKNLFIAIVLLVAGATQAQDKNAKAVIEVDGVCMMCKARIEKAAIRTKGVKSAVWNVESHQLSLILDERKTSVAEVKASVAAVGHDSEDVVATEEAYNSVHECCKYRSEDVQDDHKNEAKKKGDGNP